MRTLMAGPLGVFRAGVIVEIKPETAQELIACGYAVAVDPQPMEAASLITPEAAYIPKGKGRKR